VLRGSEREIRPISDLIQIGLARGRENRGDQTLAVRKATQLLKRKRRLGTRRRSHEKSLGERRKKTSEYTRAMGVSEGANAKGRTAGGSTASEASSTGEDDEGGQITPS